MPSTKKAWITRCKKMNKLVAEKLEQIVKKIAEDFSRTDREYNFNSEAFSINQVIVTSEATAVAIFDKSSGKQAIAFLYLLNSQGGHWRYFFPTDSHILGMRKLEQILYEIENKNYGLNFMSESEVLNEEVDKMIGGS